MKKILCILFIFLFIISLNLCIVKKRYAETENTIKTNLVNNIDYVCHTENFDESKWYMNNLDKMPLPDPHIYEENGTYYIVGTSGFHVSCYSTKDFNNYKYEGIIYDPTLYNGWENPYQAIFAPELYCFDGIYYLYYSAMDDHLIRRNSVVASKSVLGPYKPIVNNLVDGLNNPLFLDQNVNNSVLDSSVFLDDDGIMYMYYSVGGAAGQYVVGVKLDNPYMADWSTYKELVRPGYLDSTFKTKKLSWEELRDRDQIAEAPAMLKSNGKYYLTYSVNGCWNKYYNVCYAISNSPLGNFVKPYKKGKTWTNLLLGYPGDKDSESLIYQQWSGFASGTGHHCFFKIGDQTMIGYHAHQNRDWNSDVDPTVRYFAMDYIYFSKKGEPYCNGPSWSPQPLPYAISGYQNIAKKAIVKYQNVKKVKYINDDYIEDCYNLIKRNGKEVILGKKYSYIEFKFDKEYTIGGISIYNSAFYEKMISSIAYIDFGNGNVVINPVFNYNKNTNNQLQFIYPCSAISIEFNNIFTSNKVIVCFKTANGANINEIQILGK